MLLQYAAQKSCLTSLFIWHFATNRQRGGGSSTRRAGLVLLLLIRRRPFHHHRKYLRGLPNFGAESDRLGICIVSVDRCPSDLELAVERKVFDKGRGSNRRTTKSKPIVVVLPLSPSAVFQYDVDGTLAQALSAYANAFLQHAVVAAAMLAGIQNLCYGCSQILLAGDARAAISCRGRAILLLLSVVGSEFQVVSR